MQQPALDFTRDTFDAPAPSVPSPTSQRAARRLTARVEIRGRKLARLLRAYRDAGHHGLTDSEVEHATGFLRQSICSLRRAALDRGWLVATGERMGPYGTEQRVHVLTAGGAAALIAREGRD